MPASALAATLEADRGELIQKMDGLIEAAAKDNRPLNEAEQAEFDGLESKVTQIDGTLERARRLEAQNAARAQPAAALVVDNPNPVITGGTAPDLEPGQRLARAVISLVNCQGNRQLAADYASKRFYNTPEVSKFILGAAVDIGKTTDSDFAQPLVKNVDLASEFIDFLRPATIIGQLTGLRRLSFNGAGAFRIPRQTGGSVAYWVGEAKPKPATKLSLDQVTLSPHKVAAICIFTKELMRRSDPNIELLVRDDMVLAVAEAQDKQFINPAATVTPGVSPAPVTASPGFTAVSAGATIANVTSDLSKLQLAAVNANLTMRAPYWILNPASLQYLSLQRTAQDIFAWRAEILTGTLLGIPFVTSTNVPTGLIALIDAAEIVIADDGGVEIDMSEEASVQVDDAPADPPTPLVSLWQQNLIGVRVEQILTWFRRRDAAVATLTGVVWPAP